MKTKRDVKKGYCIVCNEITEWVSNATITFLDEDSNEGNNEAHLVCKRCGNPDQRLNCYDAGYVS